MAFKLMPGSSINAEKLPWAEKYREQYPKHVSQTWDVRDVKQTDKGLILECEDWAAWVWSSKDLCRHVLEFVKLWYAAKKPAPVLQLMLTEGKPYYAVGVDDERQARWGMTTQSHWHQSYNTVGDNPEASSNPLPLPSSPNGSGIAVSDNSEQELMPPSEMSPDLPLEAPGRHRNGKGRVNSQ